MGKRRLSFIPGPYCPPAPASPTSILSISAFEIGTVSVDLIPRKFGLRQFAGDHNRSARPVNFDGVLKSPFLRVKEQLLQHLDDIVVGVLIIVEQDHMKQRPMLFLFLLLDGWSNADGSNRRISACQEDTLLLKHLAGMPCNCRICAKLESCYTSMVDSLAIGGATVSTGLNRCVKACRVPSSRKTIGKQQLPIISSLHTLPN